MAVPVLMLCFEVNILSNAKHVQLDKDYGQ
jgi:hypothetical protein